MPITARPSKVLSGPHVLYRSISMIKDIIVNLEHQSALDPARDFAVTIAETFDAHVAGVAFAYTPEFPGYVVAQMRAESEKAALAAIERFDAAARRRLVSSEHRLCKTIG